MVYINQRDAQILANSLYFFVNWLYMFRTNDSPKHVEPINEKIKIIHKKLCTSLVCIHIAICCTVHTTSNWLMYVYTYIHTSAQSTPKLETVVSFLWARASSSEHCMCRIKDHYEWSPQEPIHISRPLTSGHLLAFCPSWRLFPTTAT